MLFRLILVSTFTFFITLSSYSVQAQSVNLRSDFNNDGQVDFEDYEFFLQNFGRHGTIADIDGNGIVQILDYNILVTEFGKSTPPVTSDENMWLGDAETNDFNQWCRWTFSDPYKLQIVDHAQRIPGDSSTNVPVSQGNYAYRFEISPGDERTVLNNGYARQTNECKWESTGYGGHDRYYGWSVFIPDNYTFSSAWSLVAQWKGWHTGSPVISLNIRDDDWLLNYRPKGDDEGGASPFHKWSKPIRRGTWEKFVMHVKWSADPAEGYIELWQNGDLVVPKFNTKTIHFGYEGEVLKPQTNFVEIGIYRSSSITSTNVLYHDGFSVGNSYNSVAQ